MTLPKLSSGEWHKKVPRDRKQNLLFRRWWLQRCQQSRRARLATVEACQHDILFKVNVFGWQFNPKKSSWLDRVGPFITWPRQEEFLLKILWCIENGRDLGNEKSRYTGATWLSLFALEHCWSSEQAMQFSLISRNEKMVDSKNPDSLFYKLDYMLGKQPEWMRGEYRRQKLFLEHPVTGSTINGAATTKDACIGGRATAMFIDEAAQIDELQDMIDGTKDVTDCRIFNSTHLGTGNAYYKLMTETRIERFLLHWSHDPDRARGLYRSIYGLNRVEIIDKKYPFPADYPFDTSGVPSGPFEGLHSVWYDKERAERSSRDTAMNLDIDPQGSLSQFFAPEVIREHKRLYARPAPWQGSLHYDVENGQPEKLVESRAGGLAIWCRLEDGRPPKAPYSMGWDISGGQKSSFTCGSVFNCNTGEKVAAFVDNTTDPYVLGPLAAALGRLFCDEDEQPAWMVWESAGPGLNFGKRVLECGYRRIYWKRDETNPDSPIVGKAPGWNPGKGTKVMLLEEYRDALTSGAVTNRCKDALNECLCYIYTDGGSVEHSSQLSRAMRANDPAGTGVNHGDRTIADALAYLMMRRRGRMRATLPEVKPLVGGFEWRMMQARDRERQAQSVWLP